MDPGLAEIAQEILVQLNFLVAAGEVERDFLHIVHFGVTDIPDQQPGGFHFGLEAREVLIGRRSSATRSDIDVARAQLQNKLQIFVGRISRHLDGDLDAGRPGSRHRRLHL